MRGVMTGLIAVLCVGTFFIEIPKTPLVQAQTDTATPTATPTDTASATTTTTATDTPSVTITASSTDTATGTATTIPSPTVTSIPTKPIAYLPVVRRAENTPTMIGAKTATPSQVPTSTPKPPSSATSVLPSSTSAPNITPIPSRTPSPTPVIPNDIVNGNFEQGNTGWTFRNSAFINNNASLSHSGSRSAQLGSSSDEISELSQRITIPSDRPYLTFWYAALSYQAGCYYDAAHIWIDPTPGDADPGKLIDSIYDFCNSREHSAYQKHVTDLSAYAGQIVTVEFDMSTNSGYASYWAIDDVLFSSPPAATSTITSVPSTTPTSMSTPTVTPSATDAA